MTRPKRRSSICIIGAGICGLVAARDLKEAGRDVIVLDKARGVGGRMATRRIGEAVVDHGAQFFTWHGREFQKLVTEWLTDGVAREWARGLSFPHGTTIDGSPAFRGQDGMTSIPKRIADHVDVRLSSRVLGVDRDTSGYVVHTEAGDLHHVDVLLFTAPVPQSLAILEAGDVPIRREIRRQLESIHYDPCLTLLAVLDGPSRVPAPGALRIEEGPIEFIADNHQKGISPGEHSVTIHAGREFSRNRLEDEADDIARDLLSAAADHLGASVKSHQVHRWRYGVPVLRHAEPFFRLLPEPIWLAGDAFGGPNVEGAANSGLAVSGEIRRAS